jgi:hypothetical protein
MGDRPVSLAAGTAGGQIESCLRSPLHSWSACPMSPQPTTCLSRQLCLTVTAGNVPLVLSVTWFLGAWWCCPLLPCSEPTSKLLHKSRSYSHLSCCSLARLLFPAYLPELANMATHREASLTVCVVFLSSPHPSLGEVPSICHQVLAPLALLLSLYMLGYFGGECSAGDQAQNLVSAKQTLHHWAISLVFLAPVFSPLQRLCRVFMVSGLLCVFLV